MNIIVFGRLIAISLIITVLVACGGSQPERMRPFAASPNLSVDLRDGSYLRQLRTVFAAPIYLNQQLLVERPELGRLYLEIVEVARAELGVELKSLEVKEGQSGLEYVAIRGASGDAPAVQLARESGSQAVLISRLNIYQARKGSSLGAEQGAHVQFVLTLKDVESGQEIWIANYNYRDKAVTDDLLALPNKFEGTGQRGAGWQSVEEIFRSGLSQSFQNLSALRQREFSA